MADIFISYAKEDQAQARLLAALLEANGYSVWWDNGLLSGDNFRQKIMTELGRARAVIVIWTRASVGSDWVQSEAGRAHANRVLIPIKAADLDHRDIPPPFDNMHMEPIGANDRILAAVTAQLVRPESNPTPVSRLSKQFRFQVLAWLGAAGGALTLFTNLGALLKLSEWAKRVVAEWIEWTRAFWTWLSSFLQIDIPTYMQLDLTFMIFMLMVALGSHVGYVFLTGDRGLPLLKFGNVVGWHALAACTWYFGYRYLSWEIFYILYDLFEPDEILARAIETILNFILIVVFVFLLVLRWPRSSAINTAFALGIIGTIFFESAFVRHPEEFVPDSEVIKAIPILILSLLCLLIAAPIVFHRRLWSLLAFLVLLVIGNEVAKLGLTA